MGIIGGIMKQNFNLSERRKNEPITQRFTQTTKEQVLKNYFAAKEQTYKNMADTSACISIASGMLSTFITVGASMGSSLNPALTTDHPAIIATNILAGTGIAASIISGIVHNRACDKQDDFKYRKECVETEEEYCNSI